MRSAMIGLVAAFALAAIGCDQNNISKNGCKSCGNQACRSHGGHGGHGLAGHGQSCGHGAGCGCGGGALGNYMATPGPSPVGRLPQQYMQDAGPGGPSSATVGYPYYTTRAPRDFLMDNPPSIGY